MGHIDRACGAVGAKGGPTVGELAVAVAIQRACAPGPKRDLAQFLDESLPRVSCLPGSAFTGQAFHPIFRSYPVVKAIRPGFGLGPQANICSTM